MQKHIEAVQAKAAKQAENEAKAAEKAAAKAEKARLKREAKLAKMTPEQLAEKDAGQKAREQKAVEKWAAESAAGETVYAAMQAALAEYEEKHADSEKPNSKSI